MIVAKNEEAAPLTSGNMETTDIGITQSREGQLMILNILANTLYTDKPAAVLREYGCNAADANVEAGKGDQPFEVRLPNKLDPTLSIRDFGYGMNEGQIINTFCKLGESTKRQSNAFTGMLGIGSKAGFAYGDSFLVISYVDGIKTTYNAFRDQGVPRLAKMGEVKSDAPDGVEVKVPIRTADQDEFVRKAERIFRYFKVRPIIQGAKIEWKPREQQFAGTGWRYTGNGESIAIMGNVGYDIRAAALGFTSDRWTTVVNPVESIIGLGVELDFNIGELNVAATREGLEYNDRTKGAVIDRLNVVIAEIGGIFTKEIANAPTLWEAKRQYHENFEKLDTNARYSLKRVVNGKIKWNSEIIADGKIDIENDTKDPEVYVTQFTRRNRYGKTTPSYSTYPNPHSVQAGTTTTLVINDLPSKKNSPARVKAILHADANCNHVVVFTFQTQAAQDKFWLRKKLTGAPTVLLSSFTPLKSISMGNTGNNVHNSKHSAKAFVLDENFGSSYGYGAKSQWWKNEVVDVKDGDGVYVVLDTFAVQGVGAGEHPHLFLGKVKELRKAGLITTPVYGFKPDKALKLGKGWVKLEESIKAELDALITKKAITQELADFLHAESYCDLLDAKHEKEYPNNSEARKLLCEVNRMRKPAANKTLLDLLHTGCASPWLARPALPAPTIDLAKQEKIMLQKYPLLKMIDRHQLVGAAPAALKDVVGYIRMVESI